MIDRDTLVEIVHSSDREKQVSLAEWVATSWTSAYEDIEQLLHDGSVRRWAREYLLDRLSVVNAEMLARRLVEWSDDYCASRRDRSTARVIEHLSLEDLREHLELLAASNNASALWASLAESGPMTVMAAVGDIFASSSVEARETTLHLLVLDPYGPEYLSRDQQNEVLVMALDDPDPEIRGLAAEVIAADLPELLLARWETAPLDAGERVRMAFWQSAFVHRPDEGVEAAGVLALDPEKPHEARRTALLALAENVSTRTISPVLQSILTGDDQTLAEDAAQLMWRHHRAPDIAHAASRSQFESVRGLANRLLHPEMGSPAAGGSRPGDPTRTLDIFEQIDPSKDERSEP
jgi:hypothetical protein